MAIVARTPTGNGQSATTATSTFTLPPDLQAGDLVVAMVGRGGTSQAVTPPAGWRLEAGPVDKGTVLREYIYSRVALAGDAGAAVAFDWGVSDTVRKHAEVLSYGGAATTLPTAPVAIVETVAGVTHAAPTVTVGAAGSWLAGFGTDRGSPGSTDLTPPAGLVERDQRITTLGGGITSCAADSNGPVSTGTQGGGVWTGDLSTANAITWLLVIAPASASTTAVTDQLDLRWRVRSALTDQLDLRWATIGPPPPVGGGGVPTPGPPFLVTIYGKDFTRRGWVGDYEQLTVTLRHNAPGTASLTIGADHPRAAALMEDGARVTVDYYGEQILSGPAWSSQGTFPRSRSTITFTIEDDLRLLGQVLGWPVPGAAIGAQTAAEQDVRTGPAETVVKGYVSANAVTRLGLPLTVPASFGRGSTVTARLRMDNLRDVLLPLADAAGIGLAVRQQGTGLVFDCYVPTVRTRVLTEASGVLAAGQWTRTGPSATDVVVGGQGEGTARTFRLVRSTALAAAWGTRVEAFRDATDVTATAELDARGAQTLADGAPGAGISLELAETPTFRYGRSMVVGDQVSVEVAPGLVITDLLRAVTLSHSKDAGLEVTPKVGDDSATADPNAVLAKALAKVAAAVRRISTGR